MDPAKRAMAGLIACVIGPLLMATALSGHDWYVGERAGLDVKGGVIDVLVCSKPDSLDPMPMSIGDHEGCYSEMYARSRLRAEAGPWFGTTTHMTLALGGAATGMFLLMALVTGLGRRIEVAPMTEPLAFQIFGLEPGVIKLQCHPGASGAKFGIFALVALGIAVASAPESLSPGANVLQLVVGCTVAITGSCLLDARTLISPGSLVQTAETLEVPEADSAPAALPSSEIDFDACDGPACRRCEGATLWLEDVGRHRCQKCGLYQPLHAPGSQVDP